MKKKIDIIVLTKVRTGLLFSLRFTGASSIAMVFEANIVIARRNVGPYRVIVHRNNISLFGEYYMELNKTCVT